MQWGLQILPDVVVVRMFGSPDHSLGDMFEKAAERAMSLDNRKVIIDFSDVASIDPVGLMLCGYGLYHLRQLDIPVALIRPPASLLSVLRQHGMRELPPVFLHECDGRMLNKPSFFHRGRFFPKKRLPQNHKGY
jgi:anti-anti-sigma regulatory factor